MEIESINKDKVLENYLSYIIHSSSSSMLNKSFDKYVCMHVDSDFIPEIYY